MASPRKTGTTSRTTDLKRRPSAESGAASPVPEQPLMQALRAEHQHMATVMDLFKAQLEAIEQGALVDTHVVYEIMDYMSRWPDRYHHPREDLIYGRVAELDGTAADNVDSLQREHDAMAVQGREVLQAIEGWRAGKSEGALVVDRGLRYMERLYTHMNNEEQLVFPQIEAILTADDWRELGEDDRLRPIADPVFGGRIDREFRNLARKLRRNVRQGVERGALLEWVGIEALMESVDVVSMACDSSRTVAGEHLRSAFDDALGIVRDTPMTAVLRCAVNNTRVSFKLLCDMVEISRDALEDLERVNQARKDRVRLLSAGRIR